MPRLTQATSRSIAQGLPGQNPTKGYFVLAKLVFGSGLLVALMLKADVVAISHRLRSVNLYYVLVMFVVTHLNILISSVKWRIFLRQLNLRRSLGSLFSLYLIGTFFSNFLPTTAGGDAVRILALSRETKATAPVAAATIMERLTGLAALVAMLPLALLSSTVTARFPGVWYLIPPIVIGFAVVSWFVLSSHALRLARTLRAITLLDRIIIPFAVTHDSMRVAARSSRALLTSCALSVVFYVGSAVGVWAATRSFAAEVAFGYFLATVPLVLVAGMLPISLNGLGITEAGFALFLQLAGVPLTDAVGVGLLLRGRQLFTGLVGGLLFLRYRTSLGRDEERG